MSSALGASPIIALGLAGAYTASAGQCDHYSTKAGGAVCLPGDARPRTFDVPTCGACRRPLSLVLQANAPLTTAEHGVETPERCLYLFGCTSSGCGKAAGAWRAFRCQLTSPPPAAEDKEGIVNSPTTQPSEQPQISTEPATFDSAADDFGCADFGCEDESEGAFDFSALNSALDATATAAPATVQQRARVEQPTPGDTACATTATVRLPIDTATCLPEFFIVAEPEPQDSKAGLKPADMEHIEELLARYQQEEQQGDTHVCRAAQGTQNQAGGVAGTSEQGAESGQDSDYAPEEYEDDEVRGVDPAYLKYQQRIMRCSEQCARYGWKGPLLWPTKTPPSPPPCPHCGAPRTFEFQILASLISLMMEATDLLQSTADSDAPSQDECVPYGARITSIAALTAAANWDLCTVAAFTCSQSCVPAGTEGGVVWVEEWTALVNEDECHIAIT